MEFFYEKIGANPDKCSDDQTSGSGIIYFES
jgi:hypothetical protein